MMQVNHAAVRAAETKARLRDEKRQVIFEALHAIAKVMDPTTMNMQERLALSIAMLTLQNYGCRILGLPKGLFVYGRD